MMQFKNNLQRIIYEFLRIQIVTFVFIVVIRFFDFLIVNDNVLSTKLSLYYEFAGLGFDLVLWLAFSGASLLLFTNLYFIKKQLAVIVQHVLNVALLLIQIALLVVYKERTVPLDHEIITASTSDAMFTVKAIVSGYPIYAYSLVFLIILYVIAVIYRPSLKRVNPLFLYVFAGVSFFFGITHSFILPSQNMFSNQNGYYAASNKVLYLKEHVLDYLHYEKNTVVVTDYKTIEADIDFFQNLHGFDYVSKEYPLLRNHTPNNVLGEYFNLTDAKPNVVILIVESLGSDFFANNAYGGFLPYLDSLSDQSLYWENCLSSAQISFGALPSILGSLPYGKRGFSLMADLPNHLTLPALLHKKDWFSYFFAGFPIYYDNSSSFMRFQNTDFIIENFNPKYKKMGANEDGWSYGYDDKVLFKQAFEIYDSLKTQPYCSVYFTLATHPPFNIESENEYTAKFLAELKTSTLPQEQKDILANNTRFMATYLFLDDAVRDFIEEYKKRPEYENTIFVITGDHHPYNIKYNNEISMFRVPLLIYSPLLSKSQKFKSVNNHSNIAPTILALLNEKYNLDVPKTVHWFCDELDTCKDFRNIHSKPFMSFNRDVKQYIHKEYYYDNGKCYILKDKLIPTKIDNDSISKMMNQILKNYETINRYVCFQNKIYPDSSESYVPSEELFSYNQLSPEIVKEGKTFYNFIKNVAVDKSIQKLRVEFECYVNFNNIDAELYPKFVFSIEDSKTGKSILYDSKDVITLQKDDSLDKDFIHLVSKERISIQDFNSGNLVVKLHFYNSQNIPFEIKNVRVKLSGVIN